MTTYNTGNPVGSATVKDLYDNAENLDVAINSQTAGEWTDRLGNARQTWKGIEDKAEIDIAASASAAAASASAAAAGYRDETLAARNDAQAAANAIGPIKFFDTKAQADAAVGTMVNGDIIEVSQDETRADARTRYKVQAGALVFVVKLDQVRHDLANAADPAKGAGMVGYLPSGVGAVGRNVQSKLREFVSVKDFGADSADDVTQINAAITHAMVAGVRVYFPFSATIRVPEDAPTLQAAFDALDPNVSPDVTITVRISAGHALTDGLIIEDGDFSNFQITSVDATVLLAPGFTPINGGDAFSTTSVFLARDAKAPEWRFLLNVADAAAVTGLVYTRAYGFVAGRCGVTNAGGYNLYVNNQSDVFATNAVFTGAGYGNRVTVNSQLTAPQANFSGTKSRLYVGTNRAANLDVSRGSVVYVTGTSAAPTNLTGGLGRGLAVRRSYVSATNVDCSGAAEGGLVAANGAVVAFSGSIASGCSLSGVTSIASFVAFEQGTAINNSLYNLYAEDGGRIVARNAVLTGGGTNGVLAANGGEVTCPGANCRRNGVSDQSTDIAVSAGGYVSAVGALGGVNTVALSNNINGTIIKESASIRLMTNSGSDTASTIDFDHAGLTAAAANLRFWRDTATTGLKRLLFFRGDGTGTLDAQIGVAGSSSFFASGSTVFGGSTIPASAVLSAESTTKGFLPPRMTTEQRNAIVSPAAGLVIYNTTTGKLNVRGAAAWEAVTSA